MHVLNKFIEDAEVSYVKLIELGATDELINDMIMDKYIIDISKNANSKKIYRIIENIKEVSNEIFLDDEDTGLVIDEYGKVC